MRGLSHPSILKWVRMNSHFQLIWLKGNLLQTWMLQIQCPETMVIIFGSMTTGYCCCNNTHYETVICRLCVKVVDRQLENTYTSMRHKISKICRCVHELQARQYWMSTLHLLNLFTEINKAALSNSRVSACKLVSRLLYFSCWSAHSASALIDLINSAVSFYGVKRA